MNSRRARALSGMVLLSFTSCATNRSPSSYSPPSEVESQACVANLGPIPGGSLRSQVPPSRVQEGGTCFAFGTANLLSAAIARRDAESPRRLSVPYLLARMSTTPHYLDPVFAKAQLENKVGLFDGGVPLDLVNAAIGEGWALEGRPDESEGVRLFNSYLTRAIAHADFRQADAIRKSYADVVWAPQISTVALRTRMAFQTPLGRATADELDHAERVIKIWGDLTKLPSPPDEAAKVSFEFLEKKDPALLKDKSALLGRRLSLQARCQNLRGELYVFILEGLCRGIPVGVTASMSAFERLEAGAKIESPNFLSRLGMTEAPVTGFKADVYRRPDYDGEHYVNAVAIRSPRPGQGPGEAALIFQDSAVELQSTRLPLKNLCRIQEAIEILAPGDPGYLEATPRAPRSPLPNYQ